MDYHPRSVRRDLRRALLRAHPRRGHGARTRHRTARRQPRGCHRQRMRRRTPARQRKLLTNKNIEEIIMKTNEELQAMSHDELVALAQQLQTEVESNKKDSDTWYNNFIKEAGKRKALKDAMQALIAISE